MCYKQCMLQCMTMTGWISAAVHTSPLGKKRMYEIDIA